MAESRVVAPFHVELKLEEDELELLSVELIFNLMKQLGNADSDRLPKLPKPSKFYSVTHLKSVALAWRLAHDVYSRRFKKALPFMRESRQNLFLYATYQAEEFFDCMESHVQWIYLAAYCYELSCFWSRSGFEDHIELSYTLLVTIWREKYRERLDLVGGWEHAERELQPYAKVLDLLEDIFQPDYLFNFSDLLMVHSEYELVDKTNRKPENRSSSEESGSGMRRRAVTSEDELDFLDSVLDFKALKFLFKMEEFPPEKLIKHLTERAKREKKYTDRAALLKFHKLEDPDAPSYRPLVAGLDDLALESARNDPLIDSCLLNLSSFLTQNMPDLTRMNLDDTSKK